MNLRDFDFVAAGASIFHKHMSSWGEISGRNSTLGWDFQGEILLWGEISGGKIYTGVRFPGEILHWGEISGGGEILNWGEISGGKSYSETSKGGNLALG